MRVQRVGSGYIFIVFGATFIIGALLWIVLVEPAQTLLDLAESHSSTSQSATMIGYLREGWDIAPVIVGMFGLVQLLVGSALARKEGGVR